MTFNGKTNTILIAMLVATTLLPIDCIDAEQNGGASGIVLRDELRSTMPLESASIPVTQSLVVAAISAEQASVVLECGQILRTIPASLVSVANGSSTSPQYAGPARVLLESGHETNLNGLPYDLPGRPFYRIQTHVVEPSLARGVWDYTQLDRVIDAAVSYGAEPMICLSFPPKWFYQAEQTHSDAGHLRKPYDIDDYAEHCAEIVRHYILDRADSPVLWWEIGNEAELHDWSYAYYLHVYSAVAQKLRAVDPRIKLGGPVTYKPNMGWAAELLDALPQYVDFISYHHYGYSLPFDTSDAYVMGLTLDYESYARSYRDLIGDLNLPIIVTESNASSRFDAGTDPRIRSSFGAAWLASAIGHFVKGGGDVFCFFTLNGGFGSIWADAGDTVAFPVWHTLWLYREYFKGDLIQATSDTSTVEVYGWEDGGQTGAFLINTGDSTVDVTVSLNGYSAPNNGSALTVESVILNQATYSAVRVVDPGLARGVQTLVAIPESLINDSLFYVMQPFEVRVVIFESN